MCRHLGRVCRVFGEWHLRKDTCAGTSLWRDCFGNVQRKGRRFEGAWILILGNSVKQKGLLVCSQETLPVTVSPSRVGRWQDGLTMHVVGTQVSARIMMTPPLWGIEYVKADNSNQAEQTSTATPQRAAGGTARSSLGEEGRRVGKGEGGWQGPGFTLLPAQPVTYWNQTTQYSSQSSETVF